jgi:hypothetical protein
LKHTVDATTNRPAQVKKEAVKLFFISERDFLSQRSTSEYGRKGKCENGRDILTDEVEVASLSAQYSHHSHVEALRPGYHSALRVFLLVFTGFFLRFPLLLLSKRKRTEDRKNRSMYLPTSTECACFHPQPRQESETIVCARAERFSKMRCRLWKELTNWMSMVPSAPQPARIWCQPIRYSGSMGISQSKTQVSFEAFFHHRDFYTISYFLDVFRLTLVLFHVTFNIQDKSCALQA